MSSLLRDGSVHTVCAIPLVGKLEKSKSKPRYKPFMRKLLGFLVFFFFKCYTLFLPQTMALRAVQLLYHSSRCIILQVYLHRFPVNAEQKCILCYVRKERPHCVLQFPLWQGDSQIYEAQVALVAVAWVWRVLQHWPLDEEFGHMQ